MATTKSSRVRAVLLLAMFFVLFGGAVAIAQPTTPTPPPPVQDSSECGITDIGACMADGINSFFWALVVAALNSLLRLIGQTLLTTPTLEQLPRVGELWESSRGIAVAVYGLLVLVAGIVLMAYETVQTRTTIRQVAPRIAVGFLAANLSLLLAGKAIEFANALSSGLLNVGVDPSEAAQSLSTLLTHVVMNSINGTGFFGTLIALGIVVLLISLVGTYIVRVAVTVILLAGAPLFLVCHGLELTDGIARWWWRTFAGVLGIQLGQSLALIAVLRVFFSEGGFTIFGPTPDGVVNLIATGGLLWILVKIPSWVMHHVQLAGGGRTFLGSLIRGFVMYKTFGLLRGGAATAAHGASGRASAKLQTSSDPYANARTTSSGQYMLPLRGLRRQRKGNVGMAASPAPVSHTQPGRQLSLPLKDGWPENRPVLGRDGQYRLPLDVERVTPTPPASPAPATPTSRRRPARQLALQFDPFAGNRPTRAGQYPLPMEGVHRVKASKPIPEPPAPTPRRGRQLSLPLDLPKRTRPTPKPGGEKS
ncbi:hypothetical protein JNUCC0626_48465 [Lentzea sp. JNUCC 0626]|uniref:hypothetical protein n=1 Tax=Lentzea sp. JNUCC 0626 TaxID=3367513 RepID=UPI00374907B7